MVLLEGRLTGAGSVRVTCEIGVQRSAGACRAMLNKKGADRKVLTGKRRVRVEYRTRRILSLV